MTPRTALAAALALAWALVSPTLALAASGKHHQKTWAFSFAADTLGQAPTNSVRFGGLWEVVVDSTRAPADSAAWDSAALPRVLRQREEDDGLKFHYIQFPKPVLGDMTVSMRFRIRSGEIDPSAGVMFQLDPKGRNGYIVRVSGDTGELIAHYLLVGKRRDLHYAKITPPEPQTWHTIEVERKGSVMIARYDGEEKIRLRDERFSSGGVGLWTEDDTVVDFDQLRVSMR